MRAIRSFWLRQGNPVFKERKGALTVEAALVMPVLLCAFFTVIFLVKAVCTYGLLQHALDETASEIASAGYIYYVGGLGDLHDTVRDGINDRSGSFRDQLDSIFETFDSIKSIGNATGEASGPDGESPTDGIDAPGEAPTDGIDMLGEAPTDGINALGEAGDKFRSLLEQAETAAADPLDELKTIACYIAAGTFDDAKTQLFTPIVKLYMKKYLVTDSISDADQRLRLLNIENGFDGLDFSESSFLSDRGENIDIVVKYRLKLILPVSFMPDLPIVQRSRARAWLGGDEGSGVLDGAGSDDGEDVWSLSNFKRGLKIRRIFGANLPDSFPVISAFNEGKALMIKSMDLTAPSYQEGDSAEDTLKGYINDLAKYKGQEKPWGSDGIVISNDSIVSRKLLLVIPENELSAKNESMLEDMKRYADLKDVRLIIKRYGTKKMPGDADSKSDADGTSSTGDSGGDSAGDAKSKAYSDNGADAGIK